MHLFWLRQRSGLTGKYLALYHGAQLISVSARSVRHGLDPNIFPPCPTSDSVNKYFMIPRFVCLVLLENRKLGTLNETDM